MKSFIRQIPTQSVGPSRTVRSITARSKGRRTLPVLAPLVVWLAVWQLAALWVDRELLLPGPVPVIRRLWTLAGTPDFWHSTLLTLLRVLAGFMGGVALGTAAAVLCCLSRGARLLLPPLLRTLRAVPVASFILLVLLWVPTGQVPAVAAALMALPVVWGAASGGISRVDPKLLEAARVYRMSRWKRLRLVWLPSVLPECADGCRTALGLAWKAGVAAEVLCTPRGAAGTQIYYAKLYLETTDLFAWTAAVIALSMLVEQVLGSCLVRLGGSRPRH